MPPNMAGLKRGCCGMQSTQIPYGRTNKWRFAPKLVFRTRKTENQKSYSDFPSGLMLSLRTFEKNAAIKVRRKKQKVEWVGS
jgi:hypothetical protein